MQAVSRYQYFPLLAASKGRSKASCDVSDPYMLSAIHDQEGADGFVELRLVETFITKHTLPFGHSCLTRINGSVCVHLALHTLGLAVLSRHPLTVRSSLSSAVLPLHACPHVVRLFASIAFYLDSSDPPYRSRKPSACIDFANISSPLRLADSFDVGSEQAP